MFDFENDDGQKKKKIMSGWSFLAQRIINFFDQSIQKTQVFIVYQRKLYLSQHFTDSTSCSDNQFGFVTFKNVSITNPVNTVNWWIKICYLLVFSNPLYKN